MWNIVIALAIIVLSVVVLIVINLIYDLMSENKTLKRDLDDVVKAIENIKEIEGNIFNQLFTIETANAEYHKVLEIQHQRIRNLEVLKDRHAEALLALGCAEKMLNGKRKIPNKITPKNIKRRK